MRALTHRRALIGLFVGRLTSFTGRTIVGIFLPIFLFELFGETVLPVVIFFLLLHLGYGFLVPTAGKILNVIGSRFALVLGILFSAVFTGMLYIIDRFATAETLYILVAVSLGAALLNRVFYWIPFHVDFAKFTDRKQRGIQTGLLYGAITTVSALAPIFGGYIVNSLGYGSLFVISVIVILLAAIPFSLIPSNKEIFSWSYVQAFQKFVDPENRRIVITSAAVGSESILGVVIWPLFVFLILKGDYLNTGLLSGLIIGGTALFQVLLGRLLDQFPKYKLLWTGSIFSAIGWVVKIFLTTASQIFVVGVYHNIVKSSIGTSYNAFFYEIAADGEHYVDEYTVLREMAIQFGKATSLTVIAIILLYLPLQWAFLVGVIGAIVLNITLSGHRALGEHEQRDPQTAT